MSADEWGEDSAEEMPVEFDGEEGAPESAPLRLGVGVHEISFADYLADPCVEPSLRSGDIQRLLTATPRHFIANHPRLAPRPQRIDSNRMDLGSIVHKLVLGAGDDIRVFDYSDWKKKQAQADRDQARAEGCIPTLTKTYEKATRIATAATRSLAETFGEWPFGLIEQTLIWQEEVETRDGEQFTIWCRARPDVWSPERGLVIDLKSTEVTLTNDGVKRRLSENDGHMMVQAALQLRGARAVRPDIADVTHCHLFVETVAPFEPRPIYANPVHLEMADRRCMRAGAKFGMYLATKADTGWPPAQLGIMPWLDSQWANEELAEMGETL